MIEQRARFRRIRDRSIFGDPDDIVPPRSATACPSIRDWTEANFEFAGYVTGFDPCRGRRPEACAASSATRRTTSCASRSADPGSAAAAAPGRGRRARRPLAVPGLRAVVVAGPRLDLASPPRAGRVDRGYVPT